MSCCTPGPSGVFFICFPPHPPNLHFNLTIPGDLWEIDPPVLTVDRRACSPHSPLKPAWPPCPGPAQGGYHWPLEETVAAQTPDRCSG
jgi:hypothetical protein